MPRQNLEEDAIFRLFREWDGKLSTEEFTRRLIAEGHLEIDVWEAQKARTLSLLHRYRKRCLKKGGVKEQWLNLTEINDEGKPVHYWKKYKRTSIEEKVNLLKSWSDRIEQGQVMFYLYYDAIPARQKAGVDDQFGVEHLPPRPLQQLLAGIEED